MWIMLPRITKVKNIDKLIKFDPKFKEDLTSLHEYGQFDAALNY
jgi:hypothetical protein